MPPSPSFRPPNLLGLGEKKNYPFTFFLQGFWEHLVRQPVSQIVKSFTRTGMCKPDFPPSVFSWEHFPKLSIHASLSTGSCTCCTNSPKNVLFLLIFGPPKFFTQTCLFFTSWHFASLPTTPLYADFKYLWSWGFSKLTILSISLSF